MIIHQDAVGDLILATFRLDYEYEIEIEYEYNFSILVRMLYIVICLTNIVVRSSFYAGLRQGEAIALGVSLVWNSKVVLVLNLVLVVRSEGR